MTEAGEAVIVYHNPDCVTSRNALLLIRQAGIEPQIVEYLKSPPSRADLMELVGRMGLSLRDVIRQKGTPYASLGLDDDALAPDQRLDAIEAHPILINRPIVVSPKGVKLCRPSDAALDLLPAMPARRIEKEEGAPFLKDIPLAPDDPGLDAALRADGLPTDDLAEPRRTVFAYQTLDGETVGYGGFERYGEAVLLRSIVVPPAIRRAGIGRNIVPLLLFRAFEAGARQAFLFTAAAETFFSKLGFRPIERAGAPAAILATRQASLCPAQATLMSRRMEF